MDEEGAKKLERAEYLLKTENNYEEAFKIFEELANIYDNDDAKFHLGEMYYYGQYVEQDYEMAYCIFKDLNDDYLARFYIAEMYYWGFYLDQDFKLAYEIFNNIIQSTRSKSWASIVANYYLGRMNYNGEYLEVNYEVAYQLFEETISNENADEYLKNSAKYFIALMNYNGNYLKQNYEVAFNIFNDLKENNIDAYFYLGEMYLFGRYVEQSYEKAFDIFKEIENKNSNAQYYLAKIYDDENFTNYSKEKALEFYKKSAENGNYYAIEKLEKIYKNSEKEGSEKEPENSIDISDDEIIRYYEKIANKNEKNKEKLGMLYYEKGKKLLDSVKNIDSDTFSQKLKQRSLQSLEGIKYLEKSANCGYIIAKIELAFAYVTGIYVKERINDALKLYDEIINSENIVARRFAKYVLGYIYYEGYKNGINIIENKAEGIRLLNEAAMEGEEKAVKVLKELELRVSNGTNSDETSDEENNNQHICENLHYDSINPEQHYY